MPSIQVHLVKRIQQRCVERGGAVPSGASRRGEHGPWYAGERSSCRGTSVLWQLGRNDRAVLPGSGNSLDRRFSSRYSLRIANADEKLFVLCHLHFDTGPGNRRVHGDLQCLRCRTPALPPLWKSRAARIFVNPESPVAPPGYSRGVLQSQLRRFLRSEAPEPFCCGDDALPASQLQPCCRWAATESGGCTGRCRFFPYHAIPACCSLGLWLRASYRASERHVSTR